ncbi:MAG TPA: TolC family protein [Candidatus Acidoferrales bacterium]|nr:TolC family protein [Candidatus Acidoferrales bacterium]
MIRFFCFLVLFSLFVLAASPPSYAQAQSKPLTLDDCIRTALSVPSAASLAKQDSDIANLAVRQAQAALLPHAKFDAEYTYNSVLRGRSPQQSFVALNGVREYSTLVTTEQAVDISGRLRAEVAIARAERDVAGASATISLRDLKRAVTAAYYRLLLTRHLETALRDSLTESEGFEKRTKLLLDQGEVARADLVKASAAASGLRQAYNAAHLDALTANYELAAFWTKDVTTPLDIVDVFLQEPVEPSEISISGASPFLTRPEFSLFDAERRVLLQEARRARANLFPQADVKFQYGVDSNAMRWSDRGYALFANLNVPIFDWFKTLTGARLFLKRAEKVQTTRSIAERIFSRDFENARTRVQMLFEQIRFTAAQMKASEEDVKLSRIRFDGGEGSALDVVTAQGQLAQARTNYYTAIANYLNAKADQEVARGR